MCILFMKFRIRKRSTKLNRGPCKFSQTRVFLALAHNPEFPAKLIARHDGQIHPLVIHHLADGKVIVFDLFSQVTGLDVKPILFFEYYPTCSELVGQKAFPVFATLCSLGYSLILIYQNVGRYFMSLTLDQVTALEDLHRFISDQDGFCDVVAFHREDLDIAINLRAAEHASHASNEHPDNGNVP